MSGRDQEDSTVHASAVTIGETGVLIRGPSGSGKSALALALLAADPERCRLIADDRLRLAAHAGRLVASAPTGIAGLLEVRGQGILSFPHLSPAVIRLVVDIVDAAGTPRMPEPEDARTELAGIMLPRLALPGGIADGAVRVALAAGRTNRAQAS